MFRAVILTIVLYSLWLALSGHYSIPFIVLGFLCSVFVAFISYKMGILKGNFNLIRFLLWTIKYCPWLIWKIALANYDVAKRILSPSLPIQPHIFKSKSGLKSNLTNVIYANSITLTPGTVTVDLDNDELLIHALTNSSNNEISEGVMLKKISSLKDQ